MKWYWKNRIKRLEEMRAYSKALDLTEVGKFWHRERSRQSYIKNRYFS